MEQWVHILTGLYAGLMLVNLITYMLEYDWWPFRHPAVAAFLFAILLGLGVTMAVKSIKDGYWLEVLAGAGMAFVALGVCQLLIHEHAAYIGPEKPVEKPLFEEDDDDEEEEEEEGIIRVRWTEVTYPMTKAVFDYDVQPFIYLWLGISAVIIRAALLSKIVS